MALAKVHHPDYGGDPEDFRIVNQAYRAMKKKFAQGLEIADAKTSPYSVDADFFILGREEQEWEAKTEKILNLFREHLVLSRGSGQAGRDEFADFELKLLQAPHLTDGFLSFYCFYLHSITVNKKLQLTTLKLIDFAIGKVFYVHLEDKLCKNYRYYIVEEDDFIEVTLDGLSKPIYVGHDIPIDYQNIEQSRHPLVADIIDEIYYFLDDE